MLCVLCWKVRCRRRTREDIWRTPRCRL